MTLVKAIHRHVRDNPYASQIWMFNLLMLKSSLRNCRLDRKYLTITLELKMILHKIWRRIVGNVLTNISRLNIFTNYNFAWKISSILSGCFYCCEQFLVKDITSHRIVSGYSDLGSGARILYILWFFTESLCSAIVLANSRQVDKTGLILGA